MSSRWRLDYTDTDTDYLDDWSLPAWRLDYTDTDTDY